MVILCVKGSNYKLLISNFYFDCLSLWPSGCQEGAREQTETRRGRYWAHARPFKLRHDEVSNNRFNSVVQSMQYMYTFYSVFLGKTRKKVTPSSLQFFNPFLI